MQTLTIIPGTGPMPSMDSERFRLLRDLMTELRNKNDAFLEELLHQVRELAAGWNLDAAAVEDR